jgi:hypothetical protein
VDFESYVFGWVPGLGPHKTKMFVVCVCSYTGNSEYVYFESDVDQMLDRLTGVSLQQGESDASYWSAVLEDVSPGESMSDDAASWVCDAFGIPQTPTPPRVFVFSRMPYMWMVLEAQRHGFSTPYLICRAYMTEEAMLSNLPEIGVVDRRQYYRHTIRPGYVFQGRFGRQYTVRACRTLGIRD